jgi:UDP-N-acetylmuramyl-tripeptide synthetase
MIKLSEILNELHVIQVTGNEVDVEIDGISVDSRSVSDGTLFVAIIGENFDAHKALLDVINKGVRAVVIQKDLLPEQVYLQNNVIKILVKDTRQSLAVISNIFYGKPSSKLNLIGITGTKGKSTTAFYVRNIFKTANRKNGLIGTIKNIIDDKEIPTKLTTPESYTINSLLSNMVKEGVSDCVMEVSSHSLALKRVYGLDFDIAVFTNLASDHLDYHKTRDNYFEAKKILFDSLKNEAVAIINIDDDYGKRLAENIDCELITFGKSVEADFRLINIEYDFSGTKFVVVRNGKKIKLSTSLIGEFNAYNALAAFVSAVVSGVDIEVAQTGVETTPHVPGRFEVIKSNGKTVVIDYAHTAGSLEAALKAVRKISKPEEKVFTVFGAGGDRDKTKRPEMGKVAEAYSDKIFVTSDNPRTENPELIIEDILAGLKNKDVYANPNREEAIKSAVSEADENTIVLIAGKGHETYQEINGIRNHFSDKEIAESALNL